MITWADPWDNLPFVALQPIKDVELLSMVFGGTA